MKYISKILTKFTELGLTKGLFWFSKFLGGSEDFIIQKICFFAVNASLSWLNND
jgi:hypothetical protein